MMREAMRAMPLSPVTKTRCTPSRDPPLMVQGQAMLCEAMRATRDLELRENIVQLLWDLEAHNKELDEFARRAQKFAADEKRLTDDIVEATERLRDRAAPWTGPETAVCHPVPRDDLPSGADPGSRWPPRAPRERPARGEEGSAGPERAAAPRHRHVRVRIP